MSQLLSHTTNFWVACADHRMYHAAMSRQVKLSTAERVAIKTPVKGPDGQPGEVVLTRQLLEKLTADLYRRAALAIDQACWQVSTVLLSHMTDIVPARMAGSQHRPSIRPAGR